MQTRVSAVVPVYNTEKYLKKCLDSILRQSMEQLEVIVVDDGSPDGSADIIDEYEKRDCRVRAVHTKNGGVARARNIGLEMACGEYVTFIDSDDYILEDTFLRMYESARDNDADITVCNISREYEGCEPEKPFINFNGHKVIFPTQNGCEYINKIFSQEESLAGSASNKLYRTEWLKSSGIRFMDRELIYAEDAVFLYETLPAARVVSIVDLPLYIYCQHDESVSYTYKTNLAQRCKNLLEVTAERYKELGIYDSVISGLRTKSFAFLIEILYNETMGGGSFKTFKDNVKDGFFRALILGAKLSHFSPRQRFIYLLYKYRCCFLMYLLFKTRNGGCLG